MSSITVTHSGFLDVISSSQKLIFSLIKEFSQIVKKPTATDLPVLRETSFSWITLEPSSYHILISLSNSSMSTAWARRVVVNVGAFWVASLIQSARALKNSVFVPIDHSISKYIWWKSFLRVRNSPPSVENFKKTGNISSIWKVISSCRNCCFV